MSDMTIWEIVKIFTVMWESTIQVICLIRSIKRTSLDRLFWLQDTENKKVGMLNYCLVP